MDYKELAKENYKKFSFVEGNEYIASEYAITKILKLIDDFKVSSVLELGLGIGSISDTVFKYAKERSFAIDYTGTESNEYCLAALQSNVDEYSNIHLYQSIAEIKGNPGYDLIIIDGSDESLQSIAAFCKPDTILFIEGYRYSQVELIMEIFPECVHVEIISACKNPDYGPFPNDRWAGGGQLIFINPGLYKKSYWFSERAKSFLKRRLRKLK